MVIKTKFNLGDHVWYISTYSKPITSTCEDCKGAGEFVVGNDIKFRCPNCSSGIKTSYGPVQWNVIGSSEIGKVDVEIGIPTDWKPEGLNKIQYMLKSTGIYSGTLWDEKNLFLSKEKAQKECDKRHINAASEQKSEVIY